MGSRVADYMDPINEEELETEVKPKKSYKKG